MIAAGSLLALGACPSRDGAKQAALKDAAGGGDAGAPALVATPSIRCSECHEALYNEWKESPHARAASSPLFAAMVAAMKTKPGSALVPASACARCHAPLTGLVEADDAVAHEGIGCDACHAIKEVTSRGGEALNVLALDDNKKRGRRCDAKDHYFHKMGCAPFFHDGEVCAGCHRLTEHGPSGEIAVFADVDDWKSGPFARAGVPCQDCHMPGETREIAPGAGVRADVATHGFLGFDGELRKHALALSLNAKSDGARVAVEVVVKNERAGHPVPEGLPGRQIALVVTVTDEAGKALDHGEAIFSRELVDGRGEEVPFFAATAQGVDRRIRPGASKAEVFSFEVPKAVARGAIEATLVWRALSPKLAAALGVGAIDEARLASARVAFGAAGPSGARKGLPASARVAP